MALSRRSPDCSQAQEVSCIVRKDGAVLLRGKQKLRFVIDAQVARISGCEAIYPVLAKHRGESN